MKTAHELRVELAAKQRMKKTREKWLGFAERLEGKGWDKTELKGSTIGAKVSYVEQRRLARGDLVLSRKEGVLFAIGHHAFMVINRGEMVRVKIEVTAE